MNAVAYEDIKVGDVYILAKCWDCNIETINDDNSVTITDIDIDGDIFSNDVTFNGSNARVGDKQGWMITSPEHVKGGECVLLPLDG